MNGYVFDSVKPDQTLTDARGDEWFWLIGCHWKKIGDQVSGESEGSESKAAK